MNFDATEEQALLEREVRRLLAAHWSFEQRQNALPNDADARRALHARFADLGVTGLLVPASCGGIGGAFEDCYPVLEACAAALVTAPLMPSSVCAVAALRAATGCTTAECWLHSLARGEATAAYLATPAGHDDAQALRASVGGANGGWTLDGTAAAVLGAPDADVFVVTARVGEGSASRPVSFVVPSGGPGVSVRDFALLDDRAAGDVHLVNAPATPIGDPDAVAQHREISARACDAIVVGFGLDMLGCAQAAYDMTVEYVGIRKQFGRAIGENQAIRHRVAEMYVALETIRSLMIAAVVAADRPDSAERQPDLRRARLLVGEGARHVCQQAIQCHGGIGMTEEYRVGHYLRRVHVDEQLWSALAGMGFD